MADALRAASRAAGLSRRRRSPSGRNEPRAPPRAGGHPGRPRTALGGRRRRRCPTCRCFASPTSSSTPCRSASSSAPRPLGARRMVGLAMTARASSGARPGPTATPTRSPDVRDGAIVEICPAGEAIAARSPGPDRRARRRRADRRLRRLGRARRHLPGGARARADDPLAASGRGRPDRACPVSRRWPRPRGPRAVTDRSRRACFSNGSASRRAPARSRRGATARRLTAIVAHIAA